MVPARTRRREKIRPAILNFLAGEINFSLPFLFIELPKWRCLVYESYCKNQCFHDLSIVLQQTWIYISNINIFSQLNDLVYMSCGKQMK